MKKTAFPPGREKVASKVDLKESSFDRYGYDDEILRGYVRRVFDKIKHVDIDF